MKYYLLVYDRPKGHLDEFIPFDDHETALEERFKRERERTNTDLEIVVLAAEDEAVLKRTHARYFKTLSELAQG